MVKELVAPPVLRIDPTKRRYPAFKGLAGTLEAIQRKAEIGHARIHLGHPDDRPRNALQLDLATDDARIGTELLLPERVREHHDGLRVRAIFLYGLARVCRAWEISRKRPPIRR